MTNQHTDEGIRVGYLGSHIDHAVNIRQLFESAGRQLAVLPGSVERGVCGMWRIPRKLKRLWYQIRGNRDERYIAVSLAAIDREKLNCLLGYWSTGILGDVIGIKRRRPRMKVIVNLLCHPLALSPGKVAVQNWHLRNSMRWLDGLIVSSRTMRSYLERHAGLTESVPCLIWPPYYGESLFPKKQQDPVKNVPNLLFLGRMDWRRGQPTDNVQALIDELLGVGVHVYHTECANTGRDHPLRHTFPGMPLVQIEEFATQFDASLVAYNLDACARADRFHLTVPDRLVASVTAGIPVALPMQGYEASKEYLQEYGGVIEYTSVRHLVDCLKDRDAMESLKSTARTNSAKYMGERHLHRLFEFLERVTSS